MSMKSILIWAPLGLGAGALLWAALAARGGSESGAVGPTPKPASPRRADRAEVAFPEATAAVSPGASPAAGLLASSGGGEYGVIEGRIRKMEEKLLTLEAKKTTLSDDNRELERQIASKYADLSVRTMAEWRVRNWEQLLGLSAAQKQSLLELCSRWNREDVGRPAGQEEWLARESELRSRLSVEQSARLHDTAASQSQAQWKNLGNSIGNMVGASTDEATRLRQILGDYAPPNAMLLPEGHGADWPGLMREGRDRLQSVLAPDQKAALSRFLPK